MDTIIIRHCRLRVCRHGGWSWGPDPRALMKGVTRQLPELLLDQLTGLLQQNAEDRTIQTLRIRVPVKLSELPELGDHPLQSGESVTMSALARRIRQQFAQSLQQSGQAPRTTIPMPVPGPTTKQQGAETPPTPTPESAMNLNDTLRDWFEKGLLGRMLSSSNTVTLQHWRQALRRELLATTSCNETTNHVEITPAVVIRVLSLAKSQLDDAQGDTAHLRNELVLSIALMAAHGHPLAPAALDSALTKIPMQLTPAPIGLCDGIIDAKSTAASAQAPAKHPAGTTRSQPRVASTIEVNSVLPFVLTGILARFGYLDALQAALKCAGLEDHSDCFAAAIVYKISDAPQRGWHRNSATHALAAAMGGTEQPPSSQRLARFTAGLAETVSPLDALLASQREQAGAASAILIDRFEPDGHWVAMELDGAFPLGWFEFTEPLLERLTAFAGRRLLISETAADDALTDGLSTRKFSFVTNAMPARHQYQQEWRKTGPQLWTNDPALVNHSGACSSHALDKAHRQLASIHESLVRRRPLVLPPTGKPACTVDRAISLAVGSSLATLAYILWGADEKTDPLLALNRLADLDGTVSFEETRLVVRPALGRRYMDLFHNGVLADVARVPWWQGRRLEFAGL